MDSSVTQERDFDFRVRELARECLALSERELLDRIEDLEGERDVYRQMLQYALAAHHLTLAQLDQARRTIARLRFQLGQAAA
jgi:hypothetical protein